MSENSEINEPKGSVLPSLELILIAIFFIGFSFWAINKCSDTQEKYLQRAERKRQREIEDSTAKVRNALQAKQAQTVVAQPLLPNQTPTLSSLYVSIEGLKVRKTPSTNSQVIETLSLFEEVYFLNEVTDSSTTVNLGKQMVTEPWIKIQTKKGRSGWVFGAGVHYFRRKHPGAE